MKISSSSIAAQGSSALYVSNYSEERLMVSKKEEDGTQTTASMVSAEKKEALFLQSSFSLDLTKDSALKRLGYDAEKVNKPHKIDRAKDDEPISIEELRLRIIEETISFLTGKKFRFKRFDEPSVDLGSGNNAPRMPVQSSNAASNANNGEAVRSMYTEHFEYEAMSYSAQGSVKTSDGRSIDFSVEMNMSRSVYEEFQNIIKVDPLKTLCDPLVIHYDNALPPGLSDQKFSFDLDSNGASDQISLLSKGTGFIALDKNRDGKINDGNELFGTKSGNGFADLAEYDRDGNNWIDENDEIFDKLRIWIKDDSGEDKLLALGEMGIGAIYLGSECTNFHMGGANIAQSEGVMRQTGLFLRENGTAGTVHHIDFSI